VVVELVLVVIVSEVVVAVVAGADWAAGKTHDFPVGPCKRKFIGPMANYLTWTLSFSNE